MKPKYYPTDWELSAARAVTVLRYLNEQGGVPASRWWPPPTATSSRCVDPSMPGSQALNKRVDLVVLLGRPRGDAQALRHRADRRSGT